jgi:hypothetical protein
VAGKLVLSLLMESLFNSSSIAKKKNRFHLEVSRNVPATKPLLFMG